MHSGSSIGSSIGSSDMCGGDFTINRKKSGINMNVGELSGDEQNYWNPDIHSISKAENGYYYLHYDGKDLLVKYFDESSKRSVPVCAKAECSHNSKTCNAWLDTDEYLSSPIYYYKIIYMLYVWKAEWLSL